MNYTATPLRKFLVVIALAMTIPSLFSQEIKANIQIVAPRVQMTDKQVLQTLQNAAQQFINTRKWTDENITTQ